MSVPPLLHCVMAPTVSQCLSEAGTALIDLRISSSAKQLPESFTSHYTQELQESAFLSQAFRSFSDASPFPTAHFDLPCHLPDSAFARQVLEGLQLWVVPSLHFG